MQLSGPQERGPRCPADISATLSAVLVTGMPFFEALHAPANALVSQGAQRQGPNHGMAFALTNLTWAAGEAVAASAGGALAQATSYLVHYIVLAAACLATLTIPVGLPVSGGRDG